MNWSVFVGVWLVSFGVFLILLPKVTARRERQRRERGRR